MFEVHNGDNMDSSDVPADRTNGASVYSAQIERRPPLWNSTSSLRHAQTDHSSYPHPQPENYPMAIAHYGECFHLIEEQSRATGDDTQRQFHSAHGAPLSDTATSSLSPDTHTAGPTIMSGYITTEEHNRVIIQNAKLKRQLLDLEVDRECASRACRDLAAWTYNERHRLMRNLANEKSKTAQEIEEAVKREKINLARVTNQFLEQEVNKARAEIGLPPLSKEDLRVRVALKRLKDEQSVGAQDIGELKKDNAALAAREMTEEEGEYSPPGIEGFPTIKDQVDALIAEEKQRLSIVD